MTELLKVSTVHQYFGQSWIFDPAKTPLMGPDTVEQTVSISRKQKAKVGQILSILLKNCQTTLILWL
jgi:hypothetical protein